MKLTNEEVKLLAKEERMMDSGKIKFVMFGDQRLMVDDDIMEKIDLKPGQTISWQIFQAILEENLKKIQLKIQLEKINEESNN